MKLQARYRWNGSELRAWRRRNRLSLTDVERATGLSRAAMSRWERNQATPTGPAVYRIFRATGLVDELFEEVTA